MQYEVKENETLLSIALQNGFQTTQPIIDANPGLAGTVDSNYDLLPPGTIIEIPELDSCFRPGATNLQHVFEVKRQKKDLVITLQKPDGTALKNAGSVTLRVEGKKFVFHNEGEGKWRIKDIPPQCREGELHIAIRFDVYQHGIVDEVEDAVDTYDEPPIKFNIGGMDPLTGTEEERARAVQKLLANLGYSTGAIDGDLASPNTRAALRKFQSLHSLKIVDGLDDATCRALKSEAGNRLKPVTVSPPVCDPENRNFPLDFGKEASAIPEHVTVLSKFVEPTDEDQHNKTGFGEQRFFPRAVYVAPCESGANDNLNVIRMRPRRFIFLDSGRWLKAGRDFSVVWGRHVYLCEYNPKGGGDPLPPNAREGLDTAFFNGMTALVKVINHATAHWAPESEFEWDKLIVVIPDMHLLNRENGEVWRDEFLLNPELDLLHFAEQLERIEGLKGSLQIVQIGDSYDLWIGRNLRLWKENSDVRMELIKSPDQQWSCGKLGCTGLHRSPTSDPCSGNWQCGRVYPPCRGHKTKEQSCDVTAYHRDMEITTRWSCGRAWPKCPQDHPGPGIVCIDEWQNPGMFWKCKRMLPPCPGHPSPADPPCSEVLDTVAWLHSWIREIQGYEGPWVKRLLQGRHSLPNGQTMDSLEPKLAHGDIWVNPAIVALRRMAKFADLSYLYGNHDNYLIDPYVTDPLLTPRNRTIQIGRVFLEHGHRLEARLIQALLPSNEDGAVSGYESAMSVYRNRQRLRTLKERSLEPTIVEDGFIDWAGELIGKRMEKGKTEPGYEGVTWLEDTADRGARAAQQPQYWGEFAQVWLGRFSRNKDDQLPPHVFAIGHTHNRLLHYIDIVY